VLRKRSGTKKGGKFHKEELCNFYFSTYIIKVIKSRQMSRPGHIARMREKTNV
jgi:hypothetical protein